MTPSFFVTCMCVVCMCMYACLHVLKHMCEYEYMAGWGVCGEVDTDGLCQSLSTLFTEGKKNHSLNPELTNSS